MDYYKRNLPHIQPEFATYFITFRLAFSLPKRAIDSLKLVKDKDENSISYFLNYDKIIENCKLSPLYLNQLDVAEIVSKKLLELDNVRYELICFCIMPNHVHFLFSMDKYWIDGLENKYQVTKILKDIKGSTAFLSNKILQRKGQFWHHESYDHYIRNADELNDTIKYIMFNPVKAGLVANWQDWKWSYINKKYMFTV
ncbi:MAG: transposase [FCB group bacterium]|jgi:REP element-mobilizing transposase RayT